MPSLVSLLRADPSTIVPYKSLPDGLPYTQLFQHYPILRPFYTDFEASFHAHRFIALARASWPWLPLLVVCIYLASLVVGRRVMAGREKLQWKGAMRCWNLGLCVFSLCGMARTLPHLLHNMSTMPFKDTICMDPAQTFSEGACGLWCLLFVVSKVPEMFDHAFVIAHKSKLLCFQWYHHATALLFAWHSYAITSSSGLYLIAVNYSCHALLYGYFYLSSVKKVPSWIATAVAGIQVAQMAVGMYILGMSYHYHRTEPEGWLCERRMWWRAPCCMGRSSSSASISWSRSLCTSTPSSCRDGPQEECVSVGRQYDSPHAVGFVRSGVCVSCRHALGR